MRLLRFTFVLMVPLATFLLLHSEARAADGSLQEVFSRMDQAAAKFKGLKADMRKLTHTDVINEDSVDVG